MWKRESGDFLLRGLGGPLSTYFFSPSPQGPKKGSALHPTSALWVPLGFRFGVLDNGNSCLEQPQLDGWLASNVLGSE